MFAMIAIDWCVICTIIWKPGNNLKSSRALVKLGYRMLQSRPHWRRSRQKVAVDFLSTSTPVWTSHKNVANILCTGNPVFFLYRKKQGAYYNYYVLVTDKAHYSQNCLRNLSWNFKIYSLCFLHFASL